MACWHGDVRGNLLARAKRGGHRQEPVQRVSRRQRRSNITHVAIVADRRDVQRVLPQWFLGNGAVLRARDVAQVRADLPANVRFVRGASSWTNVDTMVQLLAELRRVLQPWAATHQPILLLDCARQHIHTRVARAAARAGVWLAFVPAGMTWLLQPCDTHVFLAYKRYLRTAYADLRANHPLGEVDPVAWLRAMAQAVPEVLESQGWDHAFRDNGYTTAQAAVCSFVRRQLGPGDHVPAPASEPSADAIGAVLPRGCTFSYEALLRPARVHALPQLLDAPAVPEQAVAVPLPWAGRLRSSSRASLGQDEASLPPPPLPPPAHAPPRASLLPAPWQPRPPPAAMPSPKSPPPMPGPSSSASHAAEAGPISARTRSRSSAPSRRS